MTLQKRQRRRPIRILFVCEGNICRSPVAEILLEERLSALPVSIESAGLHPQKGASVPRPMRDATSSWSEDMSLLDEHRSRAVTPALVERSDVILTMTRSQRSEVVALVPAALHRTFVLREFARLASVDTTELKGESSSERIRELTQTLIERRVAGRAKGEDDIDDPYGRSARSYRRAALSVRDAVDAIAPLLRRAISVSRDRGDS